MRLGERRVLPKTQAGVTLTLAQTNIVSADFKANPFPFLARLRKLEPVYCTKLPISKSVPKNAQAARFRFWRYGLRSSL